MNWKLITGLSIIIGFLLFGLGWCSKPDTVIVKTETKIKIDSHFIALPVFTEIVTVKPVYRKIIINNTDTLFQDFLSGIDTSRLPALIDSTNLYLTTAFDVQYKNISEVTKDTHEVTFFFPNNHFVFVERPAPRKEIVINKETIKFIEKTKAWYQEDWFEWSVRGALFIGGVYAGSQIGGNK